jgi:flagellar FliL protein
VAEENAGKEKDKEKRSDFLKMVLIGLVVFVIAIGVSTMVLRSMLQPLFPEYRTAAANNSYSVGDLVKVGEFVSNLNDNRFVKMEVTVEVINNDKSKSVERVNSSIPIIRDTILNIIASKTSADFDSRNRENLRAEIKNALNTRLGADPIYAVYFEQLVLQ